MKERKPTILIADENLPLLESLKNFLEPLDSYQVIVCKNGSEVLHHLDHAHVDLCILDLVLPFIHGIELLKIIKASKKNIGVIITSWEPMVQNYRASCTYGADFFLEKPFTHKTLLKLIQNYFMGKLTPEPFRSVLDAKGDGTHYFLPKPSGGDTYIKFWGTRGSNPVSGADYVRYGGNTSCLEIKAGKDLVIIDAGTGIRDLGNDILLRGGETQHLEILLGHTHLDHMGGFPAFAPLYDPSYSITIRAPVGFHKSTKDLFADMLTHAFFPVNLQELQAKLSFKEMRSQDPITIGSIRVETHHTFHPGPTFGFRIQIGPLKFGYITDNEALMGYHGDPAVIPYQHELMQPHHSLIEFLKGCDFLIHEAQYTPDVYATKVGWGHSSINNATALIKPMHPKLWIVTHHDPSDTDTVIQYKHQLHQDLLEHCGIDCQIRMAHDGLKINF